MSDSAPVPPKGPRPVPNPSESDAPRTEPQPVTPPANSPSADTPAPQDAIPSGPEAASTDEEPAPPRKPRNPDKGPANPNRQKRQQRKQRQGNPKQEPPKVVEVAPIAPPAQMRRRHWGVLLSFVLLVLAPVGVSAWYLWAVAHDQYGSVVGFTVRQEEGGNASDMLGGFAASLGGASTQKDTDILYEYMQSRDLVVRVNEEVDALRIMGIDLAAAESSSD